MKICIHSNQIDKRGTGKVPFDYGKALKKLGHEVHFATSKEADNSMLDQIEKEFPIHQYNFNVNYHNSQLIKPELERIVEENQIDFFHMIKFGKNDNVTPENCRTGIQCVFDMSDSHGDVYTGVSDYLAQKFKQSLSIGHIINKVEPNLDLRKFLDIPENATVIGRHGGVDTFNLPFVHSAVKDILLHRTDVYFLFLSTNQFINHPRVIFLPFVKTEQEKFNFIHACDIMIHARADGETFGLSVAEFSISDKPVITWSGNSQPFYDKAHLSFLKDKAIIYNQYKDLLDILYSIKRDKIPKGRWDMYSETCSEKQIMKQYHNVFLKSN